MANKLLDKLIFGAKSIAYRLKEKPKANIDDHVMEHMIFYHGLTGSSPENDKETKIVRADIKEAISDKSATELSLSLKISPVIWHDRLFEIVSNLTEDEKQSLISLLVKGNPSSIEYPDWQVRANAANILAWLNAKEIAPALAATLESDTAVGALSFCQVAYALGKLQGEPAKLALQKQLTNADLWLRVDVAGSLAYFPFESTGALLTQALLDEQEALDYMAYAISRQHKPTEFLQAQMVAGACRLIYGILEAAHNSFSKDLVSETQSDLCLPELERLVVDNPDPIIVDTVLTLADWLHQTPPALIATDRLQIQVINNLEIALHNKQISGAELTHSIRLVGRLKMEKAEPLVCELLDKSKSFLSAVQINYLIVSLGQLGDEQASTKLIAYANQVVDVSERCQKPLSKQPVYEDDSNKATAYWYVLKALGSICAADSFAELVSFLYKTLTDYAPDKRATALESLTALQKKNPQLPLPEPLESILRRVLKDPSPIMQLAAIEAVENLEQVNLINDLLPLIDAQENTVSKQAIAGIASLYKSNTLNQEGQAGRRQEIKTTLQAKAKMMKEEHKKVGILDILSE